MFCLYSKMSFVYVLLRISFSPDISPHLNTPDMVKDFSSYGTAPLSPFRCDEGFPWSLYTDSQYLVCEDILLGILSYGHSRHGERFPRDPPFWESGHDHLWFLQ